MAHRPTTRTARLPAPVVSALLMVCWMSVSGTLALAQPRVVVSVKPLHALVAGVMEGVGTPDLLMHGGASPHAYTLRPSEARTLQSAAVVFWAGPALEVFLRRPLQSLAHNAVVVRLLDAPGLSLLDNRKGGAWSHPDHADRERPDAHAHDADAAGHNPHAWLDPRNAAAMARYAARVLSKADPGHATAYAANAERLEARLTRLDTDLAARLRPYRRRPFLVFHDAYPYLEARYGLNAAGAITVNPDQAPGARRVRELRDYIQHTGAVCVFSEPQFAPRLVHTLVEGTSARTGVLDPLGADLPAGPGLYEALMRRLAEDAVACLSGQASPRG